MIIIKTLIGIISIIAIAYVLHAIGKLTQRYVLHEPEEEDLVLIGLSGMLGVALMGAVVMVFVVAYMVGEAVLTVI